MRRLICLSIALALAPALKADERPSVGLTSAKAGESPGVEVAALPKDLHAKAKADKFTDKQWHPFIRVVVGGGTQEDVLNRPAMAGTYTLTATGVRFDPQFPLVPGREYVAIVHDLPNGRPALHTLSLPKPPPGPRAALTAVYPSANRLPENTLRLYLHFSGEVARGDVYRHLKLVRDDGVEVKDPFLELGEELWSNDGTRLTVLFHPGRVKRNLVPREQEGPILEEGRSYTLSVSGKWEDTEGRPIVAAVKKTFSVGPPDDQPVDLEDWAIMAPRANSDSPLIVKLAKPLDHGLLNRTLSVIDAAGNDVPGELTVGGGERVVTFAPAKPWGKGEYRLRAESRLEDVCGNRVGEPFEVDVFKPITPRIEAKYADRKFTAR